MGVSKRVWEERRDGTLYMYSKVIIADVASRNELMNTC